MTIHSSGSVWSTSTRQVAVELDAKFPRRDWTSTYPGHGEISPSTGEANKGQYAIDLMVSDRALGEKIAQYAWDNRKRLGIRYVIFWGRIISETSSNPNKWVRYFAADDPNPSKSHHNHVHISRYSNKGYTPAAGTVVPPVAVTPPVTPPVVKPTPKGITTPVRFASVNAEWPGFASVQAKVKAGTAKPWSVRKGLLAAKLAGFDVVALQELGEDEAADLAKAMGEAWAYQRLGLNCVFWRVALFSLVKTRELTLPAFGQWPGRWYIEVWLKDKAGNPLRVGSTHLTVKSGNDAANQLAQIKQVVAFAAQSSDPLVIGIDTNNTQAAGTGIWVPLEKGHYSWDRGGIDAILWAFGVKIPSTASLDLGAGSDHDARSASLTTAQ